MQVTVTVFLKSGILDPESQAVLQAVHNLGETQVQNLTQKRQFVFDVLTPLNCLKTETTIISNYF